MATTCFSSPLFFSKPKITSLNSLRYPSSSVHYHYPEAKSLYFLTVSSSASSNLKKTTSTRFAAVLSDLDDEQSDKEESLSQPLPCQLYVCNLPSAYGISELLHMFKSFGTVQSVEVSRDAETGLSRGCGYVTMSSINEAKAGIAALDGSDVGGRELRVTFAVDVDNGRRNIDALNSTPKRDLIFESPYKLYAGNLTWSIRPEDLRNLFCQFGTVVSARVLQDRKAGKNRVYGFLSFSSAFELEAAMALNGTDYHGRKIILREVRNKIEA